MEKIIVVLVCVCLWVSPVNIEAKKAATSGVDENGNTWNYDVETSTLTFSGLGKIEQNYSLDGHSDEPAWYKWRDKTKHIVIKEGITGIGEGAFYSFFYVQTIRIADTVVQIDDGAFQFCVRVKKITISNNVKEIGAGALEGFKEVQSIQLPKGLKKMGCLAGYKKLKTIIFPDSIIKMEKSMLNGCTSLTKVHLPDKLKEIKGYDFWGCKKLAKLEIPVSVKSVAMSAFVGAGLKKIVLPENVTIIKNGDYGRKVFKYTEGANYPTKNLRVIEIHSKKVKSIQKNSFSGLSSKVVIKVPESKKKKYTKMLRKSGLSKKVKIKALICKDFNKM